MIRCVAAAALVLAVVAFPIPLAAQSQEATAGRKISLGLIEFAKQSGSARFDLLQSGIPAALELILLSDERLVLVGPEELSSRLARAGQSPGSRLLQSGLSADVSRALGVDYVLLGSYLEFQGEVMLSATLRDLRNNRQIKLELVATNEKKLMSGIETLAVSVQAVLRKQGVAGYTRLLAVFCFEDRTSPATSVSNLLRRDLAVFLGAQLSAREGTRVVEWRKVEQTCDKRSGEAALAQELDADAVVSGWFKVQNDVLYVSPALYIRVDGTRFDMPAVKGRVADYLQLKVDLGRKVDAFLDGALGSDGTWKVAELVRTTRPEDNLKRGRELYEKGDLNLATLYLEQAAASGSVPDAYYYLGMVQSQQKKFEEAASNLERYVQLRPQSGPAQRALGLAYVGLRKYDAALAAYEGALKVAPSLQGLYVDVGNAYFFKGKFEDAKRYYVEGIAREPGDSGARFNLGLVAERLGNDDEAIRWYTDALRINPQDARAQRALGSLFNKRGDEAYDRKEFARAIREHTEEIAYWPAAPGYYGRAMARAYLLAQQPRPDYSEVVRDYEEAVKRGAGVPADAEYRRAALINLTEAYILAGRFQDAHDAARRATTEMREDRDRRILRYLLVASQILMATDYAADLALLRGEVANAKDKISRWDFSLLDKFYNETSSISEPQRRLMQQITQEFKKAAMAQGK